MWNAFSKIRLDSEEVPYVQCNTCRRVMSYKQYTGTGSLRRHAATHQLPLGSVSALAQGGANGFLMQPLGLTPPAMDSISSGSECGTSRPLPAIRIEAPHSPGDIALANADRDGSDASSSEDSAPKMDPSHLHLRLPSPGIILHFCFWSLFSVS